MAFEQSHEHLFCAGLDNDAVDVLAGLGVRFMFQAVPRTATTRPFFNRTVNSLMPSSPPPKVKVVCDDLRTDYLAAVSRDIGWTFGFIHKLADQQAAGRGIHRVLHVVPSRAAVARRTPILAFG